VARRMNRAARSGLRGWPRRPWVWLILLCLAVAGGYLALARPSAEQQRVGQRGNAAARAMPVGVASVGTGDIHTYVTGLGTVVPHQTVTVRTRVDGQLMKVYFREGQFVKKGELLAEIDPRPYQVQLVQAEGQLARDQALLKNAQLDLRRYRGLFKEDSIAKQQLDTQAALVRQYEGTIKADRGQIENAELQLVYSRITAPIRGRLGLRQVDPGNIVHAADQNGLVVITELQPITVIFPIPEDNLPAVMRRLRAGDALPVEAWSRDDRAKLAAGVLLTADNQIDPTTGTIKLKAEFPNEDGVLFPNQFVNARMRLDTLHGATVIPTAAVQRGTQGTFVYLVKPDQTVALRPVNLGPTEGAQVAVESGLVAGDVVVVDGADKLREGSKVEVASANGKLIGPPASRAAGSPRNGGHRHRWQSPPSGAPG
jgi:multidrug efflux system membrane fusion protein